MPCPHRVLNAGRRRLSAAQQRESEYAILAVLRSQGPTRIGRITALTGLHERTVRRALRRLESRLEVHSAWLKDRTGKAFAIFGAKIEGVAPLSKDRIRRERMRDREKKDPAPPTERQIWERARVIREGRAAC